MNTYPVCALVATSENTVTVATFSAINTAGWTSSRFVIVQNDETNGGFRTTYFFDGVSLNWVPLVGV